MINKVMPLTLPQKARNMVRSVYHDTPAAEKTITDFFSHANKDNLHGPALISYYSAISEISKETGDNIISVVSKNILNKVKNNEELVTLTNEFTKKLNKDYPKSKHDRISILSNNAVIEGSVKPVSKFKRFWVVLNKILREA